MFASNIFIWIAKCLWQLNLVFQLFGLSEIALVCGGLRLLNFKDETEYQHLWETEGSRQKAWNIS